MALQWKKQISDIRKLGQAGRLEKKMPALSSIPCRKLHDLAWAPTNIELRNPETRNARGKLECRNAAAKNRKPGNHPNHSEPCGPTVPVRVCSGIHLGYYPIIPPSPTITPELSGVFPSLSYIA
ncbi:hypothetical protein PAXRUDRAFT_822752 [Paxillus rubicundulus Ve08.2h10]|uniref:Uncharacterized protein n=1 Tax=Paxillus rubicundulus Ve08.2h10 TaxID=930991 RepID=A0A0D0E9J8_9AGAM|nr:hypothetical protein PAXRUDRAFT_822752 [Paxillus rubicundulus Ve08.2h10]